MANRAYLRIWTRGFSEATMVEQFVRFLASVPHSTDGQHFMNLIVQPIDATEPPAGEWDLRGEKFGPAETAALAMQYLHDDTAYFVSARWDLWQFDLQSMKWGKSPAPLSLVCRGPEYDGGIAKSEGNFQADLGFEHLFTGHAGLLGTVAGGSAVTVLPGAEDPVEQTFLRWMTTESNRREYHQKTRENIQQLFDWMGTIERALEVERMQLTSEGEENFEARLDAIHGHA